MVEGRHFDDRPGFKFRMIGKVIRYSGLYYALLVFLVVFIAAAVILYFVEPAIGGLGDSLWFLYEVVATIGLGDYTCVTAVGRVIVVIVSILSIFMIAVLTAAVVSFCQEMMRMQREETISQFLIKLENLDKLEKDELAEISESVKRYHRRKLGKDSRGTAGGPHDAE